MVATGQAMRAVPACVAEEHVQEAWLRTWKRGGDIGRPGGYARQVRRNLAVDWVRRQRAVPFEEGRQAAPRWREDTLDRRRMRWLLRQAPPTYREVLQRLYLDEEPVAQLVAEVAGGVRAEVGERAWGRARDVVYKRRRRGLKWMREQM